MRILYALYVHCCALAAVVVRSALIPFNCEGGVLKAEPSIVCSTSSASGSYRRMLMAGAASMVLYGIGVPLGFGFFLYRHRVAIRADQAQCPHSATNPLVLPPFVTTIHY